MDSNSRLRIAILVPSLHGGGAEFVASKWGEYLASRGDSVTFLTTHADSSSQSIHLSGRWFGGRVLSLRKRLKKGNFDVVLALAPHWNLLILFASFGLQRRPAAVISGRTIETEAHRAGNNKAIELLLAKFFYRIADGYIAISHATAAEAQARFGIQAKKLWIIPNPALGKVDSFNGSKESFVPERPSGFSAPLNLVVPGRLTPSKRPTLAMQVALQCSADSGRKVILHFFGSGKAEEAAKSAVPPGIEVIFHGWVENWFQEVPLGAVILLPSRIEGFANVLIEATAMGFPTVASSRALGVSDAIVPGITGELALSDSASDYARAVFAAEKISPGENVRPWLVRFTTTSSGSLLRRTLITVISNRSRT